MQLRFEVIQHQPEGGGAGEEGTLAAPKRRSSRTPFANEKDRGDKYYLNPCVFTNFIMINMSICIGLFIMSARD